MGSIPSKAALHSIEPSVNPREVLRCACHCSAAIADAVHNPPQLREVLEEVEEMGDSERRKRERRTPQSR